MAALYDYSSCHRSGLIHVVTTRESYGNTLNRIWLMGPKTYIVHGVAPLSQLQCVCSVFLSVNTHVTLPLNWTDGFSTTSDSFTSSAVVCECVSMLGNLDMWVSSWTQNKRQNPCSNNRDMLLELWVNHYIARKPHLSLNRCRLTWNHEMRINYSTALVK